MKHNHFYPIHVYLFYRDPQENGEERSRMANSNILPFNLSF